MCYDTGREVQGTWHTPVRVTLLKVEVVRDDFPGEILVKLHSEGLGVS